MTRIQYFVWFLGMLALAAAGTVAPFRFTAGLLSQHTHSNARDTVQGVFHAPFFAPKLYGDPTDRLFGSGPSDGLWGVREYELDARQLVLWWAAIGVATIAAVVMVAPAPKALTPRS